MKSYRQLGQEDLIFSHYFIHYSWIYYLQHLVITNYFYYLLRHKNVLNYFYSKHIKQTTSFEIYY